MTETLQIKHDRLKTLGHTIIALQYEPWRSQMDTQNKKFDESAFNNWYDTMMISTSQVMRVLQALLNVHLSNIWFGKSRDNTHVQLRRFDPNNFSAKSLPCYLTYDIFDKQVSS